MRPRATLARDAGLALISRVNRWMIAGAVAATGVISVAAAESFKGHTVNTASQPAAPSSSSQSSSSSSSGGGFSQPAQSPAASAPAPAPVVSGGS